MSRRRIRYVQATLQTLPAEDIIDITVDGVLDGKSDLFHGDEIDVRVTLSVVGVPDMNDHDYDVAKAAAKAIADKLNGR